ncbi:hypothetical protein [Viscerimonas tarda]
MIFIIMCKVATIIFNPQIFSCNSYNHLTNFKIIIAYEQQTLDRIRIPDKNAANPYAVAFLILIVVILLFKECIGSGIRSVSRNQKPYDDIEKLWRSKNRKSSLRNWNRRAK